MRVGLGKKEKEKEKETRERERIMCFSFGGKYVQYEQGDKVTVGEESLRLCSIWPMRSLLCYLSILFRRRKSVVSNSVVLDTFPRV